MKGFYRKDRQEVISKRKDWFRPGHSVFVGERVFITQFTLLVLIQKLTVKRSHSWDRV